MSQDEQDAAILRLVKERAEAKRQRSMLESELRAAAEALDDFAGALKHLSVHNSANLDGILAKSQKAAALAAPALLDRLQSYLQLDRRVREFNETAKNLGID